MIRYVLRLQDSSVCTVVLSGNVVGVMQEQVFRGSFTHLEEL